VSRANEFGPGNPQTRGVAAPRRNPLSCWIIFPGLSPGSIRLAILVPRDLGIWFGQLPSRVIGTASLHTASAVSTTLISAVPARPDRHLGSVREAATVPRISQTCSSRVTRTDAAHKNTGGSSAESIATDNPHAPRDGLHGSEG